jgi:hypothetical protein
MYVVDVNVVNYNVNVRRLNVVEILHLLNDQIVVVLPVHQVVHIVIIVIDMIIIHYPVDSKDGINHTVDIRYQRCHNFNIAANILLL